jgi:hypothetical protein
MRIATILPVFAAAAVLTLSALSPASAACREDLVGASQTIERTRTGLESAAPAAKCAAYRQHVAALTQVRDVFARCDTGASKAKHSEQVGASLAELRKQMQASCKR